MPEIPNEMTQAQNAERATDERVKKSFDDVYKELLSNDQEAKERDLREQFDNIRKHGFTTQKDIDEAIKPAVAGLMEKIAALEEQNVKLLEAMSRRQARGQNSGVMDGENRQTQDDPWKRPFMDGFRR